MSRFALIAAKFIYSLFILWLGVLAPLIFFDQLAANHLIQPYRFALFEASVRPRALSTKDVGSQLARQLKQRFIPQQDVISSSNPLPGLAHLLQSNLGQLYFMTASAGLLCLLSGQLKRSGKPAGASADLPPPEKPPRLTLPQP